MAALSNVNCTRAALLISGAEARSGYGALPVESRC